MVHSWVGNHLSRSVRPARVEGGRRFRGLLLPWKIASFICCPISGLTVILASHYFLLSDSCSVGSDGMAAWMAPRQPCCSHLTFCVWLDGRNWPFIFCLVIAILWINKSADLFPSGTSSIFIYLFIYSKLSKLFLGYIAVLLFILYSASSVIPNVLWSCRLGDILKEFALLKFMWIPGWWICNLHSYFCK